jgi:hypothetical protein
MPWTYVFVHAPAGLDYRAFIPELLERPFFSDIHRKLSSDDRQGLSRVIVVLLAEAAPLNGQAEDFARIERLVPPGFETHFYYQVGVMAMVRHPNELLKAVAAVEFLLHRSAAAHHLALIGIYRAWPRFAALDSSPESLANAPAAMPPELAPHYWRAIGHLAGRYWYDTDRSLSLFNPRVDSFMPRLDPSVQRSVLQGIGQALFTYPNTAKWLPPAELERFPQSYQEALFEGWGMALGEEELSSPFPWKGQESPYWTAWTKGFSARSFASIQQGKAQFDALFEGAAASALKPPRQTPLHKQP